MLNVCEHNHTEISINGYDPTRTTTLRNDFVRESNRRFNEFTKLVKKMVSEKDVFGLKPRVHTFQELPEKAFEFLSNSQRIEEFDKWLEKVIQEGLIGKYDQTSWLQRYIRNAYRRGISRALEELRKAKYNIPYTEEMIMNIPLNLDVLELLYTRAFSELKGITSQMEQQISRVLAQGFIDKDDPILLAKKLVAVINGTGMGNLGITDTLGRYIPAMRRAEILARTEIVRAHHLAMVQEFRRWRVKGVSVMAEWRTAGDERVCISCASMEGKVFTLDEIEGMIPLHPMCRCCIIPLVFKE
jgi:SPP1 gp7 family putative phage head morphogenesis protein